MSPNNVPHHPLVYSLFLPRFLCFHPTILFLWSSIKQFIPLVVEHLTHSLALFRGSICALRSRVLIESKNGELITFFFSSCWWCEIYLTIVMIFGLHHHFIMYYILYKNVLYSHRMNKKYKSNFVTNYYFVFILLLFKFWVPLFFIF